MPLEDLADDLGEEPNWLRRKLHGQAPADLGDIMAWVNRFGLSVLPRISSSRELLFDEMNWTP